MEDASIANAQDTETVTHGPFITSVLKKQAESQALYAHLISQGYNKRQAAREAGYSARVSRAPRKLIETPELRERIQRALRNNDAGLNRVAQVVAGGMSANLSATFEGAVTESDVPDHKTRVQAAKTAADLWGLGERVDRSGGGSTVTLTLAGPLAERFAQALGPKVIEGE